MPGNLTTNQRDKWLATTAPTSVQLAVKGSFGKANINQSFTSEVTLRHVLPFIYARDWALSKRDKELLEIAYYPAKLYSILRRQYSKIDFRPLLLPNHNWENETTINHDRAKMITACFLHYNFDTASVIRYIGGAHTGEHRDTEAILAELEGKIDPAVWQDLARVYRSGCPAYCNAEASDENFIAYYKYGNHKSAYQDEASTLKALVKDFKKSFCLCADERIIIFIPHAHLTPLGMVNILHRYKKARPVFDSTHHPFPWCFAINDWTSKYTEPELKFPESFEGQCIWIWNLRITYPDKEIYPCDDDIQGAFRHAKYNPFLVALHIVRIFGFIFLMTGLTFGDCTSPQNFEPIPRARSEYAQWIWLYLTNLMTLVAPFMPAFTIATPPTAEEKAQFVQANRDSKNTGVLDENGNRKPPAYKHHVDDNLYADIAIFLARTIAASIYSLYIILGKPQPHLPDPLSHEKLKTHYTHERVNCGKLINTRRMELSLTPEKRDILVFELEQWLSKSWFSLLDAASLCGLLSDAARICRWAWPCFFALRNIIAKTIRDRHHQAVCSARRLQLNEKFKRELPSSLWKRIDSLVSKDIAKYVWNKRLKIKMQPRILKELKYLHSYLKNPDNPWSISIGHVIPRDPTWTTAGDASFDSGAGLCHDLQFLFDIVWSPKTRKALRLNPKHPGYVHINHLEFIVLILQYAAIIQLMENGELDNSVGVPILLIMTDNMTAKAWTNKVTTECGALKGQDLVSILTALLRRSNLGIGAEYINTKDNTKPDLVSRIHHSLPFPLRKQQILAVEPLAIHWRTFLPSPTLLSCLSSILHSNLDTVTIPKQLGHFEAVSHTSCISCTL